MLCWSWFFFHVSKHRCLEKAGCILRPNSNALTQQFLVFSSLGKPSPGSTFVGSAWFPNGRTPWLEQRRQLKVTHPIAHSSIIAEFGIYILHLLCNMNFCGATTQAPGDQNRIFGLHVYGRTLEGSESSNFRSLKLALTKWRSFDRHGKT